MTDLSPLIAFSAGVVSISSPCVLPLIPAIMAYSTGKGRFRPLSIVLGVSLSFTIMGVAASALGMAFIGYVYYMKVIAGIVIIFLGLYMLSEKLEQKVLELRSRMPIRFNYSAPSGSGGFTLGLSLGIVWIPCVGPILGAILSMVAVSGSIPYGALLLFIYSLGLGAPMLIIAYSSAFSSKRLSILVRYNAILKRIAGIVLIVVGLYMMPI
ncbi:MAG: cytochrome c biogenesis CcdA family protein [Methanocellales archaeon]|nr:cytochrome c biogenesis CcdA family protein [Methanocellales archaeon]MDD5235402.1 cytochrome c biogenesis CcdA family protein [Methanocellales archaeon]MDD5484515.1 cytochrome c biogenesis CcdA family protein [Methanocellales archaeon]